MSDLREGVSTLLVDDEGIRRVHLGLCASCGDRKRRVYQVTCAECGRPQPLPARADKQSDFRQGVSAAVHAVLDLLDARRDGWAERHPSVQMAMVEMTLADVASSSLNRDDDQRLLLASAMLLAAVEKRLAA
jgi:hypothetical protein